MYATNTVLHEHIITAFHQKNTIFTASWLMIKFKSGVTVIVYDKYILRIIVSKYINAWVEVLGINSNRN